MIKCLANMMIDINNLINICYMYPTLNKDSCILYLVIYFEAMNNKGGDPTMWRCTLVTEAHAFVDRIIYKSSFLVTKLHVRLVMVNDGHSTQSESLLCSHPTFTWRYLLVLSRQGPLRDNANNQQKVVDWHGHLLSFSIHSPHEEILCSYLSIERNAKTDQTGRLAA